MFFLLSHSCVPCNSTCQTCFGEGDDQCLSCSLPRLLFVSSCVTKCPAGMFHSQVTHSCESCHATCESCSGPSTNDCQSCKGIYTYVILQGINVTDCESCTELIQDLCSVSTSLGTTVIVFKKKDFWGVPGEIFKDDLTSACFKLRAPTETYCAKATQQKLTQK